MDDGDFSLKEFYYNIVELFETDDGDEWVVDTLDWWTKCVDSYLQSSMTITLWVLSRQVFGTTLPSRLNAPKHETAHSRLLKQRRERAAQRQGLQL